MRDASLSAAWPRVLQLFDELDLVVNASNEDYLLKKIAKQEATHFQWINFTKARLKPMQVASEERVGSIAAHPAQAEYYFRMAASPAVKVVCEIGFNVGHSAAVWLLANERLKLETFDLFDTAMSNAALHHLQGLFPGRITAHAGDSQRTVLRARVSAPCDIVHVDGRHRYEPVVRDFLSMRRHASPRAHYLFDDQCNASRCTVRDQYASGPTLAVCDLMANGFLRLVDASYVGPRQWALFEDPHTAEAGRGNCSEVPLCAINWTITRLNRAGHYRNEKTAQAGLSACAIAQSPPHGTTFGTLQYFPVASPRRL